MNPHISGSAEAMAMLSAMSRVVKGKALLPLLLCLLPLACSSEDPGSASASEAEAGDASSFDPVVVSLGNQPPGPVRELQAKSLFTNDIITLIWQNPLDGDLDHLQIFWQPPDGPDQGRSRAAAAPILGERQAKEIAGLQDGIEYTFTVISVDTGGLRSLEPHPSIQMATANTLPPDNVTELTAQPEAEGALLTWRNPDNRDLRQVEINWQSASGAGSGSQTLSADPAQQQSARIEGLQQVTDYTFTLVAVDSGQNRSEAPHPSVSIATGDLPPRAPTALQATADRRDIHLQWQNPNENDLESVEITWSPPHGTDGGSRELLVDGAVGQQQGILLEGFQEQNSYQFSLTAIDRAGNRGTAAEVGVEIADIPPNAPAELAVSPAGSDRLSLTWTNPDDPDLNSIEIHYERIDQLTVYPEQGLIEHQAVAPSASESALLAGLSAGAQYRLQLRSVDHGGNRSPAPHIQVESYTAAPDQLVGLTAEASVSSNSIELSWVNPSNSDLAQIEISYGIPGETALQTITLDADPWRQMSHTIADLQWDTDYEIHFAIIRSGAEGEQAATLTARTAEAVDRDGDGLIEIYTLSQLNAIRADLNGDGFADTYTKEQKRFIRTTWPYLGNGRPLETDRWEQLAIGKSTGCPEGQCRGYELMNDLDFNTDSSSPTESNPTAASEGDFYWRDGQGWESIGSCYTRYNGAISTWTPWQPFSFVYDALGVTDNKQIVRDSIDFYYPASILSADGIVSIREICYAYGEACVNPRLHDVKQCGLQDLDRTLYAYNAIFEGNGHTIHNLYIRGNPAKIPYAIPNNQALFRYLGPGGEIRNLNMETVEVHAASGAAAVVGKNINGRLENVHVTHADIGGRTIIGGLLAWNGGLVVNSSVQGTVTATDQMAGGLAGYNQGDIRDSYAEGTVYGSFVAGGLVGLNWSKKSWQWTAINLLLWRNSYNSLEYILTDNTNWADPKGEKVGNLNRLPDLQSGARLIHSHANSDVLPIDGSPKFSWLSSRYGGNGEDWSDSNRCCFGGLVGRSNRGQIWSSSAKGSVRGGQQVGGLVGSLRKTEVGSSFSTATVEGYSAVGGLVGTLRDQGRVENSYASGKVLPLSADAASRHGGLVGQLQSGELAKSYSKVAFSADSSAPPPLSDGSPGALIGYSRAETRVAMDRMLAPEYYPEDIPAQLLGTDSDWPAELGYRRLSSNHWKRHGSDYGTSHSMIGDLEELSAEPQDPRTLAESDNSALWETNQMRAATAPGVAAGDPFWQWSEDRWDFGSDSQLPVLRYNFDLDGDGSVTTQEDPQGLHGALICGQPFLNGRPCSE